MEVIYQVPVQTNVTVRIFDEDNRLVSERVSNAPRLPEVAYSEHWDGTIWDGSLAHSGLYYVSVELSNGNKDVYPVFVRR